jgi:hypothetical protein
VRKTQALKSQRRALERFLVTPLSIDTCKKFRAIENAQVERRLSAFARGFSIQRLLGQRKYFFP